VAGIKYNVKLLHDAYVVCPLHFQAFKHTCTKIALKNIISISEERIHNLNAFIKYSPYTSFVSFVIKFNNHQWIVYHAMRAELAPKIPIPINAKIKHMSRSWVNSSDSPISCRATLVMMPATIANIPP
jgi:hypothetical protein